MEEKRREAKAEGRETLLSAARRVVRFFNIDMSHGGLTSVETQKAIETLDIQVSREQQRLDKLGRAL